MKKPAAVFLFIMLLSASILSAPGGEPAVSDEEKILGLMKAQEDSWNRGDFEGFMATYWKSDKMSFQSGNNRLYGWETLLDRYKTNYAGENRGLLTFTDLEITILEGGFAYAIGRYNLKYLSELKQGLFTLIFKEFNDGGWAIIHDHSSS